MEAAVQLLANIIALLTPLPYFRPILMTVADVVLDAGEMYSNSVSSAIAVTLCYDRFPDLSLGTAPHSSVDSSSPPKETMLNWE